MTEPTLISEAKAAAPASRSRCYIEPAPLVDVIFEQLDSLVAHTDQGWHADCPECARFKRVKNLLLVPFRDSRKRQRAPRTLAA